ncbi:trypsin-like peptidase domain-containing protein [Persicirhabdus sediminis]|uniref:Trypsin-like peptidase domain-containing protein n=1 Tax=Persicirhabdus sediminis TaxID=454144 RepID=A0A8J7SLI7_9BACT|nr:trypsin-like peptidase domain-containing protein [Persicirhabdus sediminis]MBK1792386.1 trypsin-like peptidase domain-containing protein [Persicirhabdus sediminis]
MTEGLRRIFILLFVFAMAFFVVLGIRFYKQTDPWEDVWTDDSDRLAAGSDYSLLQKSKLNLSDVEILAQLDRESATLTNAVLPSVVSIDTRGTVDGEFDNFFRIHSQTVKGQGSGVIVTHEGHVMTNNHVVAGKERIKVTFHDGTVREAVIVGADVSSDLAVLKIIGDVKYPPLKFGDSDDIRVGNRVFAVGNPFGLGGSVSYGAISAKKRAFSDSDVDLLQTSAAINPGSSGGPLVNYLGEIIGINSRIYSGNTQQSGSSSQTSGFIGIGFAIPSNDALHSLRMILGDVPAVRGYLGLGMDNLNRFTKNELDYQDRGGVIVKNVVPRSPAHAVGLQPNDIIISYQGRRVLNMDHLIDLIHKSKVGDEVVLGVWRNGQAHKLRAAVGERQKSVASVIPTKPRDGESETERVRRLGVLVRAVNAQERAMGLMGIVVDEVIPGGDLEPFIETGDIVLAINDSWVTDVLDFYERLSESLATDVTTLTVRRGDKRIGLTIQSVRPKAK